MSGVYLAFCIALGIAAAPFIYAAGVAVIALVLFVTHRVLSTLRGVRA